MAGFWQADGNGEYDNEGYTLRGHQYTDENGKYMLVTVVPGEYPGRTPHIHIKVKSPSGQEITSQLFIPGVVKNRTDNIYDEALLMEVKDAKDGKIATFNFVIDAT